MNGTRTHASFRRIFLAPSRRLRQVRFLKKISAIFSKNRPTKSVKFSSCQIVTFAARSTFDRFDLDHPKLFEQFFKLFLPGGGTLFLLLLDFPYFVKNNFFKKYLEWGDVATINLLFFLYISYWLLSNLAWKTRLALKRSKPCLGTADSGSLDSAFPSPANLNKSKK